MSDINSREWYDAMFAEVKEILETLVMLEAAFVGYINKTIEDQPVTLSWDREVVTVTADKFKWQMPIAWFIELELIEKIVAPENPMLKAVRSVVEAARPNDHRALPAATDSPDEFPTRAAPAPVAAGDSLIVGGVKVPPGVKSVEEILAEGGLEDDTD
jgi:hypothetical protein